MKRIIAIALLAVLALSLFAGCSSGKTDYEYIKAKKELIIGITIYDPMNYYEEDGVTLTGFDTEFAEAVCEKLGLTPKFQIIDWDTKEIELNAKNIDCIWNGFTVTEERKQNIDFSVSYIVNKQVPVIKAANADKYTDIASMAGASTAAEGGSAGESAIQADASLSTGNYTAMPYQSDVLLEVKSGTVDVGVIDYVMAKASIGEGTDYADLMIVDADLTSEEYAIGFRKNSPETVKAFNDAIAALAADGTLAAIAAKYDLVDQLGL